MRKADSSVFSSCLQQISDRALGRSCLRLTSSYWLLCLPPTLRATPVIRPKRSFCKWTVCKSFCLSIEGAQGSHFLRLIRTSIVSHRLSTVSFHSWLVQFSIGLLYLREITIYFRHSLVSYVDGYESDTDGTVVSVLCSLTPSVRSLYIHRRFYPTHWWLLKVVCVCYILLQQCLTVISVFMVLREW